MADPLSLVSGVVGTVAVGIKLLKTLYVFTDGVKSAPEEIMLLTRELEDLCDILGTFAERMKGQSVSRGVADSSEAILNIFIQLDHLITVHTITDQDGALRKSWKQVKWYYIEKDIADLRFHLNSNKGNLMVSLALANEIHNGQSHTKLERVQGTLQEVIDRLQDRDLQTVATAESFSLQRWREGPSTIMSSSRPTTPGGFSDRSVPMSAYRFNDMGRKGKAVLTSDGLRERAYVSKTGRQRRALNLAEVLRAGSSTAPTRPLTKFSKSTPLKSIPEPESSKNRSVADDSESEGAAVDRGLVKEPAKNARMRSGGAFGRVRSLLDGSYKKRKSQVDLGQAHAVPLDDLSPAATAPEPVNKPGEDPVMEPKPPPGTLPRDISKNSGGPQKLVRKAHAIWPPQHDGFLSAGKPLLQASVFLEPIAGFATSRDDSFELNSKELVRVINYSSDGFFHGQVYPNGTIVEFRRSEFRLANSPSKEELKEVELRQIEALLKAEGFAMEREVEREKATVRKLTGLDSGLGIGGAAMYGSAAKAAVQG